MTDERLRELERAFRESGLLEDEARWLRERVRTGDVPERDVRLQAYLGVPLARLALGLEPAEAGASLLEGDAIPLSEDEVARLEPLARDLVRRARWNIERAVRALEEGGFTFAHPHAARVDPAPGVAERLARFEAETRLRLPLLFRLWLEEVGQVDLRGGHRRWPVATFVRDAGPGELVYVDPLVVIWDVEEAWDAWRDWSFLLESAEHAETPFRLRFAPGPGDKVGEWGPPIDVDYALTASPRPTLDARVGDDPSRDDTFLEHVRRALAWAGFPGFAAWEGPPVDDLRAIAATLEPL